MMPRERCPAGQVWSESEGRCVKQLPHSSHSGNPLSEFDKKELYYEKVLHKIPEEFKADFIFGARTKIEKKEFKTIMEAYPKEEDWEKRYYATLGYTLPETEEEIRRAKEWVNRIFAEIERRYPGLLSLPYEEAKKRYIPTYYVEKHSGNIEGW